MSTNIFPVYSSSNTAVTAPRSLPCNHEAEQALLAALLNNNHAYEQISEYLLPEHFSDPALGQLYAAIRRLLERNQLADSVTLQGVAESDAGIREAGGAAFMQALAASAITIINVGDYGKLIYDAYLRRQLIAMGENIVNDSHKIDFETEASIIIEGAEKKLYDLATSGEGEKSFQSFERATTEALRLAELAYKRQGKLSGISTGLADLDRLMGGLQSSDLLILAGRPSMGKTSLATNIAFYAANHARFKKDSAGRTHVEDGAVVGFFSLEMSAEQLAARILSEQAQVASEKLRRGDMNAEEFNRLVGAAQRLNNLPLYIDDTPAITIQAMRTRARRLQRQHHLGMIIVDYLQLMRADAGSNSQSNRVQEISEITRGLKAIAKELNVPVIALSQLSRAVESREDKRPQLSDLRESGSIEQDADIVMFVFREEYYLARAEPMQNAGESSDKFNERYQQWQERLQSCTSIAEVIIAKQRHGPIGKVKLLFDGETTKFSNLAREQDFSIDE